MWVSEAKQRCPQLLILPYEFEAYASAAEDMYRAVLALTPHVMGISCDECYADATGCGEPAAMATQLRAAIARATGARRRAFLAAPSLPRFLAALPCRAFLAALPCRAFLAAPSLPRLPCRALPPQHATHGCTCHGHCITRSPRRGAGCTASVGIGPNRLLARLATRHATPDSP